LFACAGILFNHESPLRLSRFVTSKIVSTVARIANGSGGKLTLGNLDIYRDWLWAPDYVDAMWRILQCDQTDDFVVATGEQRSLRYFAEEVFKQVGLDWREHVESDPSLFRLSDIKRSSGNAAKAEAKLGWKVLHRFDDIIRLLVEVEMAR
jgi:GDPmannose 4,6-dehydratase